MKRALFQKKSLKKFYLLPLIWLVILTLGISSCKSEQKTEYGAGGSFKHLTGRKYIYKLTAPTFSGYYQIENGLSQTHNYTLVVLLDMKQVSFEINGAKTYSFKTQLKPFAKKTFRFKISNIPEGKHNLTTVLFQDLAKTPNLKNETAFNNVWDKAIVIVKNQNYNFSPKKLTQYSNPTNFSGVAFTERDTFYIPAKLTAKKGEKLKFNLAVATKKQEFEFALVFFINGKQQPVNEGNLYISGKIKKNSKVIIPVSLKIPTNIKRGVHRLDIFLITSPYSKEDVLSQFVEPIRLEVK